MATASISRRCGLPPRPAQLLRARVTGADADGLLAEAA